MRALPFLLFAAIVALPAARADEDAGTPPAETVDAAVDAGLPPDPDALVEAAGALVLSPTASASTLRASVTDAVDPERGDAADWWRVDVAEPGRLTVTLKPSDRSSRVRAELFLALPAEPGAGARLKPAAAAEISAPASAWVRVYVPEGGDGGGYTLVAEHARPETVVGAVVELDRWGARCVVVATKGADAGVRRGVRALVRRQGALVASGVADTTFPTLTRVAIAGACDVRAGDEVHFEAPRR